MQVALCLCQASLGGPLAYLNVNYVCMRIDQQALLEQFALNNAQVET